MRRTLKLELEFPEIPDTADSSYVYDLIRDVTMEAEGTGFKVLKQEEAWVDRYDNRYIISTA